MRYSWMNPKLEVRESPLGGRGVFACEGIEADEMLFVMGGYILTLEEDNDLRGVVADKAIEISDYFFIGPRDEKDLERMPQHFVNHSCEPNEGFKGQIFMMAMRTIDPGEEITYDYAMVMCPNPESNSFFSMPCRCGRVSCRETITEDDWEITELQERYYGWFQWYITREDRSSKKGRACESSQWPDLPQSTTAMGERIGLWQGHPAPASVMLGKCQSIDEG